MAKQSYRNGEFQIMNINDSDLHKLATKNLNKAKEEHAALENKYETNPSPELKMQIKISTNTLKLLQSWVDDIASYHTSS